jgi:tetratricopeptide (TPR) repeat protein
MQAAERALRIDQRDADALELRGTLQFERYARNLAANPAEEKRLLRDAQADLIRATEINPAQANAWNVLSTLDYRKPDVEMAHIHARRALEADAWLAAAEEVLWRLFATSYDVEHRDDAVKWCNEGRARFRANPRFVQCRLWIGVMDRERPDVDGAWAAAREYVALVPAARRPLAERQARMLVAIPLIYAGRSDSARRVLASARADRSIDADGMLITPEALALTRLGERAAAIRLLTRFLAQHPQHRAGVTRNTWWWKDLQDEPEFKALIGTSGR